MTPFIKKVNWMHGIQFQRRFHMEPDKAVWIEKLGVVIEIGDIRLVW